MELDGRFIGNSGLSESERETAPANERVTEPANAVGTLVGSSLTAQLKLYYKYYGGSEGDTT